MVITLDPVREPSLDVPVPVSVLDKKVAQAYFRVWTKESIRLPGNRSIVSKTHSGALPLPRLTTSRFFLKNLRDNFHNSNTSHLRKT